VNITSRSRLRMVSHGWSVEITDSDAPVLLRPGGLEQVDHPQRPVVVPQADSAREPEELHRDGFAARRSEHRGFWARSAGGVRRRNRATSSRRVHGQLDAAGYITDVSCRAARQPGIPAELPALVHARSPPDAMPVVVHIYSPGPTSPSPIRRSTRPPPTSGCQTDDTPFNDADNPLTSCGALPTKSSPGDPGCQRACPAARSRRTVRDPARRTAVGFGSGDFRRAPAVVPHRRRRWRQPVPSLTPTPSLRRTTATASPATSASNMCPGVSGANTVGEG
jgi:hypothetical protein